MDDDLEDVALLKSLKENFDGKKKHGERDTEKGQKRSSRGNKERTGTAVEVLSEPEHEASKEKKRKTTTENEVKKNKKHALSNEVPSKRKRVIIIGAGMAGITAARELSAKGFAITVLEARDRIGGRINTIRTRYKNSQQFSGNFIAEAGSSFIHGIDGNPVAHLCNSLGLQLKTTSNNCILYDEDGKMIPDETDTKVESLFNRMINACDRLRDPTSSKLKADLSLGSVLQQLMTKYEKMEGEWTEQEKRIIDWHIANIEGPLATSITNLSLFHWDQDEEFAGEHCLVELGHGKLIEELASAIEDIRTDQIVKAIRYEEHSVRIQTANGETHQADAVLVTVPLGVLKKGDLKFDPPLPEAKVAAIQRLGFGLMNKVFLYYEKPFWDLESDYIGHTGCKRGEFYLLVNMFKSLGQPLLMALYAGQVAYEMELLKDNQISEQITAFLEKIYKDVPKPKKVHVTRWNTDPWSCGSYSYIAVGSTGDDYELLAQPVNNTVFFAGEATSIKHPSTVAGAYLSGKREAHNIIRSFGGQVEEKSAEEINSKGKVNSKSRQFSSKKQQKNGGSGGNGGGTVSSSRVEQPKPKPSRTDRSSKKVTEVESQTVHSPPPSPSSPPSSPHSHSEEAEEGESNDETVSNTNKRPARIRKAKSRSRSRRVVEVVESPIKPKRNKPVKEANEDNDEIKKTEKKEITEGASRTRSRRLKEKDIPTEPKEAKDAESNVIDGIVIMSADQEWT